MSNKKSLRNCPRLQEPKERREIMKQGFQDWILNWKKVIGRDTGDIHTKSVLS